VVLKDRGCSINSEHIEYLKESHILIKDATVVEDGAEINNTDGSNIAGQKVVTDFRVAKMRKKSMKETIIVSGNNSSGKHRDA
jgi:hypothetical protein